MEISREVFDQQRKPRFGTANPERMRMEFWEWMIRGDGRVPDEEKRDEDDLPLEDDLRLFEEFGMMIRNDILKSANGPWRARDLFGLEMVREDGPIWNFDRMGSTRVELPDGRMVHVGGEHEDHYDPDFCIYNDVVVFGPDDSIEIYGYPKEIFPPTDFHTATLVGGRIILIGGLGYPKDRRAGHTPVYELDLSTYRIAEIVATGDGPGWIHDHEAILEADGTITVRGGEVLVEVDGGQALRRNVDSFSLDLHAGEWRRLSAKGWTEFAIRRQDHGFFRPDPGPVEFDPTDLNTFPRLSYDAEEFLSFDIAYSAEPSEDREIARLIIQGVPTTLKVNLDGIEILVEGQLPGTLAADFAESVREMAEAVTQAPCRCVTLSGPG